MTHHNLANKIIKNHQRIEFINYRGYSRCGNIKTSHGAVQTPRLFPVINFIGGTTTNCGGMWKYTRQHIFGMGIPIMSEIMHFLDYHLSERALKKWRTQKFREWFPEFTQPVFLDSGGYQLLNSKSFDLTRYGLKATPKSILELQLDFGADIIATLDYPLPPNLKKSEAEERVHLTIENAITALRLLQKRQDTETLVFVPIHGRTPQELTAFLEKFVQRYKRSRLERKFDGLAVGSLVPIRNDAARVIELLWTVKNLVREHELEHLPLHVFGVGSDLIPFLVYLGFDTFDSSSYAQNARTLRYAEPETWVNHRVTQLRSIECECSACQQIDLAEMRTILKSDISFRRILGRFKSEYYALVAMHNLNQHLSELKIATRAAQNDTLESHLVEFSQKRSRTKRALEFLSEKQPTLRQELGRKIVPVQHKGTKHKQTVSMKYKPKDFSIPSTYQIPKDARVLFLFPCSKQKPYSKSQTFRRISNAVSTNLNGLGGQLHFVVVSGLYGPVPLEYDSLPQTRNYDFVLSFMNKKAVGEISQRIAQYVQDYGRNFDHIIALATTKPYRKAIEKGLKETPKAQIFPKSPTKKRMGKSQLDQLGLQESMQFLQNLEEEHAQLKSKKQA